MSFLEKVNEVWKTTADWANNALWYVDQAQLNGRMDTLKNNNSAAILTSYLELVFLTTSPKFSSSIPLASKSPVLLTALMYHMETLNKAILDETNLSSHVGVLRSYLFMIRAWNDSCTMVQTSGFTYIASNYKPVPYRGDSVFNTGEYRDVPSIIDDYNAKMTFLNDYVTLIFEVEKIKTYYERATITGYNGFTSNEEKLNYQVLCQNIIMLYESITKTLSAYPTAEQSNIKHYFKLTPVQGDEMSIGFIVSRLRTGFESGKSA